MLIGDKCKRGSPMPLVIETTPGSMKFVQIQGVEQDLRNPHSDPQNHQRNFRNQCRMDRCRRVSVVKMPTLNAPTGFYEEAIFMMSEVYLVKEGTVDGVKVLAFEQDGESAAPVARTPREDSHFFEYIDEKRGGHRRLFQVRFGELFEILWDASKPLSVRYMRIFTKGFPGSIKKGSVAAGVGLLITKEFDDDGIACALVRVPAPLKSFDVDSIAQFSLGASYTTVTWPELGWGESKNSTQIMWSEQLQAILTLGDAVSASKSEFLQSDDHGSGKSPEDEFIRADFNCAKCRKYGLKGMAWIPKTPGNDYALCTNCYDGLDVDTRIATAADLQLTDMDALFAKSVIPFVPLAGETLATKLDIEHLSSKQWNGFSAAKAAQPVRAFVPRTHGPITFKTFPIAAAFSRCGTMMGPPTDVEQLSIVAGWESKPKMLPETHLVNGWKRYDSLRDLLADNLGAIVFICRRGGFGGRQELKVNMHCFLDFVEKFSDDPQEIHIETALESSYSTQNIKLSEIVWLGVVDYDVEAASNPDRETLILNKHGF
jgi:hypothetical protein